MGFAIVKKSKKIIIAIIILLLLLSGYSLYRYQQAHTELTLYGNVDIRTVNLGFRVTGRLTELLVDEGDTITRGQLIGKLDAEPYQNALRLAKAQEAEKKAALELLQVGYRDELIAQTRAMLYKQQAAQKYAENFYQRQLRLWKQKTISENALDDAKTARDKAQSTTRSTYELLQQYLNGNRPEEIAQGMASLEAAEAVLAQAKLNLQDTELRASSAGTIMTRAIEPGTIVNAGSTVFTLALPHPVWIRAYIDEINLNQAVPGAKVAIYTDARPNQPYQATIGFVSPTAEFTPKAVETPELRTSLVYRLRLIVNDADEQLRQGMPVTIKFRP